MNVFDNFSPYWLTRMSRSRFDVILQDELNHPSLFILNRLLKRRVDVPIVSIVHHLRSREPGCQAYREFHEKVERLYLKSVDGFVFNSVATKTSVEELIGAVKGTVAYPGGNRLGVMDEKDIISRLRRRGPLRLVFVGNIIPRKNLEWLIRSLSLLRTPQWELGVIGSTSVDPVYTGRLVRLINQLGLEGKVRLLGQVPDARLAQVMRECDLIALPFSYEGFGIVYLEAMAFGLPGLACSLGGASEIIEHGKTGFLLAPGDIESMVDLMHRLIMDRAELLRLSLSSRRSFDRFPSWEESAINIREFLTGLFPL
jgi:glycosyltransferase involved in cell wall biosynthesis